MQKPPNNNPPQSRVYALRMWREDHASSWRLAIRTPHQNTSYGLANTKALIDFLNGEQNKLEKNI